MQENNKRSAAQRILLAQLKQHAINTAMEDHSLSKKEESAATGFAKNFNPYPVSLNDVFTVFYCVERSMQP